ncbi:hypothetical protein [Streptomyces sp. 35G-GA-8]|uniref:hypothetical protein n=1 Tax=Streptomyces sp. 35G-GA-8 TaxID=2939434 RepID=UPI00201F006B|nr:hypothetical protein [Streptomyces sp. 35G-GA-8]
MDRPTFVGRRPSAVADRTGPRNQEVRTLMTVTTLGAAQEQKFINPTPVVSG